MRFNICKKKYNFNFINIVVILIFILFFVYYYYNFEYSFKEGRRCRKNGRGSKCNKEKSKNFHKPSKNLRKRRYRSQRTIDKVKAAFEHFDIFRFIKYKRGYISEINQRTI